MDTATTTLAPALPPINPSRPMEMTDSCIQKIKELKDEEGNPDLKLRVFVQGGGCSGFSYGFTFDEIANEDDTAMDYGDVTVLVDSMSLMYLVGASVDFEESISGSMFKIRNPNASSSCGCGSSFSV